MPSSMTTSTPSINCSRCFNVARALLPEKNNVAWALLPEPMTRLGIVVIFGNRGMHRIRLRGPWQKQLPDGSVVRISVPEHKTTPQAVSSPQSESRAVANYARSFNRPTGLNRSSRVLLELTDFSAQIDLLQLNDQELSLDSRCEITGRLAANNRLALRLSADETDQLTFDGEVSLLIDDGE